MMAINMKEMVKQLELHEGLRLKPYYDTVDKLTIGIGRNLEDTGISKAEASFMLQNDLIRIIAELDEQMPWWRELTENRRRILVDMAFNLGTFGLSQFRDMLAATKVGDFDGASKEMLDSKWAKQVGARAERLAQAMKTDQIDLA
jgi:lysozyme